MKNDTPKPNSTVRRNSRFLKGVFEKLDQFTCKVFTLSNSFSGEDCPPSAAKSEFDQFSFVKVRYCETGALVFSVHSNCWYELRPKAA